MTVAASTGVSSPNLATGFFVSAMGVNPEYSLERQAREMGQKYGIIATSEGVVYSDGGKPYHRTTTGEQHFLSDIDLELVQDLQRQGLVTVSFPIRFGDELGFERYQLAQTVDDAIQKLRLNTFNAGVLEASQDDFAHRNSTLTLGPSFGDAARYTATSTAAHAKPGLGGTFQSAVHYTVASGKKAPQKTVQEPGLNEYELHNE